jgi:hypothetical protein
MPLKGVKKPNGSKNPKGNGPKETKQHICGVESEGLPNLTKKKNDEKPKR